MKKRLTALLLLSLLPCALAETMPAPESNGAWRYYIPGDGTADLYVYLDADATEVEIPATPDGHPATVNSHNPLWACPALTKIIVKEGSFAQRYCQENGLPFAGE